MKLRNFNIRKIFELANLFSKRFSQFNYLIRIIERKVNNFLYLKKIIPETLEVLSNFNFQEIPIKLDLPTKTAIEINNTCNLNCLMCNTKLSTRAPGYIELQMFELILNQLMKIGFDRIALHTVGEPLLYKNLDNLFEIIKKYKFKVSLSTNGQLPKQLRSFLSNHWRTLRFIRFSIDASTSKTYEEIRRGAKFSRLIKSLEIVHKFNRNKINYYIPIKIDSIINLININELSSFFKVYGKYCFPESINFNLISGLSPDNKYFLETFPFPNLIKKMVPCKMVFTDIYFTYDGKATLCCRDYNGDLIVGNLGKNSIIEIWNGEKAESIREQHLNKNVNIKCCNQCFGTYSFITPIINNYIHYLYRKYPKLSSEQVGKKILFLLKDMDDAMKKKDKLLLKKNILNYFMN